VNKTFAGVGLAILAAILAAAQPTPDPLVHVMVEGAIPPAAKVAGDGPRGLSPGSAIRRLHEQAAVLGLPGIFVTDAPPLPILEPDPQPDGSMRVKADRYYVCGRLPASHKRQLQGERRRVFTAHRVAFAAGGTSGGPADAASLARAVGTDRISGTGYGVLAAIVDDGFSKYKRARWDNLKCDNGGAFPCFDPSVKSDSTLTAGGVDDGHTHGAMVAYDVTLTAPDVTLADLTLTENATTLCDPANIYVRMIQGVVDGGLLPKYRGIVMVNSWQVADFSDPDLGDYATNIKHPLNVLVSTMEALGVDIVFAAGNCGGYGYLPCPHGDRKIIYGANSHPGVLTVGAAGFDETVKFYSGIGPGWIGSAKKPDLVMYSDFVGSGALDGGYDSGTSAAAPVAAGVLAAVRELTPFDRHKPQTYPEALRQKLRDAACKTYTVDGGYGVLNTNCTPLKAASAAVH
jgi:hypothetical protein